MPEMSSEHREALKNFNAEQNDWYGWCRHCGKKLEGKVEDIRNHNCASKTT